MITTHALSFDLEEWYHGEPFARCITPEQRISQVREALPPVLALLRRYQTRATFFSVGEVVRDHPDLVRALIQDGHEVACHGMTHTNLPHLDAESFGGELEAFERTLRVVAPDQRAVGFRAPMFSVDRRTGWALGVLKDSGYLYDSSVFPVRTGLYGLAGAPLDIYRASSVDPRQTDADDGLLEFPLAVCSLWGIRVPAAGGVYMRLLPYSLFRYLLRRIARQRPAVLYIHPWEMYALTPRAPLPLFQRLAAYHNVANNLARLGRLLEDFRFVPVREVLDI